MSHKFYPLKDHTDIFQSECGTFRYVRRRKSKYSVDYYLAVKCKTIQYIMLKWPLTHSQAYICVGIYEQYNHLMNAVGNPGHYDPIVREAYF